MCSDSRDNDMMDYTPTETREMMVAFVKIIERHPDIYQSISSTDIYRSRFNVELAWKHVFEAVKTELNLECTPDEIKSKWKGIRSSYTRYKNKCRQSLKDGTDLPRKYYLFDALEFLEPHIRLKQAFRPRGVPETAFVSYDEKDELDEDDDTYGSETAHGSWANFAEIEIVKSEPEDNNEQRITDEKDTLEPPSKKLKTNKNDTEQSAKKFKSDDKDSEDNEDLQFFRHILPDIAHFTRKEKRRLKIGILKLVDDIENERQKNASDEKS